MKFHYGIQVRYRFRGLITWFRGINFSFHALGVIIFMLDPSINWFRGLITWFRGIDSSFHALGVFIVILDPFDYVFLSWIIIHSIDNFRFFFLDNFEWRTIINLLEANSVVLLSADNYKSITELISTHQQHGALGIKGIERLIVLAICRTFIWQIGEVFAC